MCRLIKYCQTFHYPNAELANGQTRLNYLQVRCCGFNRSQNWVRFGPFEKLVNGTLAKVPVSCCADRSMLKACLELEGNYFENGCESKIQSYFWVIGGVGIAVLVVEVSESQFFFCSCQKVLSFQPFRYLKHDYFEINKIVSFSSLP